MQSNIKLKNRNNNKRPTLVPPVEYLNFVLLFGPRIGSGSFVTLIDASDTSGAHSTFFFLLNPRARRAKQQTSPSSFRSPAPPPLRFL